MEKRKRDRSRNTRYDYRPEKGKVWSNAPEITEKPKPGRMPMMPWEIGWRRKEKRDDSKRFDLEKD